ncbi:hypothetical protein NG791_16115 [Laspinema sp. D1]|uniref:hypothetical protein n=1 Tax=Laspinema palackyanum TaxID=3231601 RepID=UPI0034772638|nr:hypothetical protein [Laspinema sp. D2b]
MASRLRWSAVFRRDRRLPDELRIVKKVIKSLNSILHSIEIRDGKGKAPRAILGTGAIAQAPGKIITPASVGWDMMRWQTQTAQHQPNTKAHGSKL